MYSITRVENCHNGSLEVCHGLLRYYLFPLLIYASPCISVLSFRFAAWLKEEQRTTGNNADVHVQYHALKTYLQLRSVQDDALSSLFPSDMFSGAWEECDFLLSVFFDPSP